MDKLSHKSKKELYTIVRNDCIRYIAKHELDGEWNVISNYSIFNRHWNNDMRHSYNLEENYILFPEFENLCTLSRNGKKYEEGFMESLYHMIYGYNFGYAWEKGTFCDDDVPCLFQKAGAYFKISSSRLASFSLYQRWGWLSSNTMCMFGLMTRTPSVTDIFLDHMHPAL